MVYLLICFCYRFMKNQEEEQVESSSESRSLQKYKARLLLEVVALFLVCLIILLERVFYQAIIEQEQIALSKFQLSVGLTKRTDGVVRPYWISDNFFTFLSFLSQPKIQFMLLTHFFISIYVAVSAFLATKIMFMTMALIYGISFIQMIYKGARPFWTSENILASGCMNSFSHPSLGVIIMLFIPFYAYYCWNKRQRGIHRRKIDKNDILGISCFILFIILIQFLNVTTGTLFLINIGLSLIFFLFACLLVTSFNKSIDVAIRRLMVYKEQSQSYEFKWIFVVILLQAILIMIHADSKVFMNINWIKNYAYCAKYLEYGTDGLKYNQLIGSWFNLLQTACIFAWLGSILGVSLCNRRALSPNWYQGTKTQKYLRLIVANLLLIPSWIFVMIVEDDEWKKRAGLNQFIIDSAHYFLLYLWIFGFMPKIVFERLLKISPRPDEDKYVILKDSE